MANLRGFSVVVIPENGGYSAWTPDLDVASQGDTIDGALANLKEAIELHLECLTPEERSKLACSSKKLMTTMELPIPS